MKWQRNYEITITTLDNIQYTIAPPFSVSFSIKCSLAEVPNEATVTIFNLGKNTRNALHKDKFTYYEKWPITIKAGYGNQLYLIFKGNIIEAYSERKEADWITTISAMDGQFVMQNFQISESLSRGGDLDGIISGNVKALNMNIGQVLVGLPKSRRGMVAEGTLKDLLDMTVPGGWFIDREELNIIGKTGVIGDVVFKLNRNQLLATPRKRDRCLECETLFYPQLQIGRYLDLENSVNQYNGQYQIAEVNHDVDILGSEGGSAVTKILLFMSQYAEDTVFVGSTA
ncbi:hypothetical protein NO1_1376 [Candidatus Termititenax aidoneus]|uniref:Uncharacterized protein n=1 Tax=Termititenax aidoneus TaxID=2218524 RepID=A0A388TC24_TERA1|nr:hypothetical protein NO1_1376 [Candidatus Termititenax aidoneus]